LVYILVIYLAKIPGSIENNMIADSVAHPPHLNSHRYLPKYYAALPFLALLLLMLAVNWRVGYYPNNDDAYYLRLVQEKSFTEFVSWQYLTWTGRLFSAILHYVIFSLPIVLWKFLNTGMILLLTFSISLLLFGWGFWNRLDRASYVTLWFLCVLLGWLKHTVLELAVFWVTGSLDYLWPLVLAAFAMVPFVERAFHSGSKPDGLPGWFYPLSAIAGICACLGVEQAAVLLLSASVLCCGYLIYRTRALDFGLAALLSLFILASVISAVAPGNPLRYQFSLRFIPGFENYSLQKRAYMSFSWILSRVFNQSRMLTLLSFGLILGMSAGLIRPAQRWLRGLLVAFTLILIGAAASWFEFYQPASEALTKILFSFQSTENMLKNLASYGMFSMDFFLTQVPLLIWGSAMIVFLVLLYQLPPHSGPFSGPRLVLIFGIGLLALFIVSITPTIYESGQRTTFAFNLAQMLVIAVLFKSTFYKIPSPFIVFLFALPIINFIMIANYLLNLH
jgi:hypothetical protein